MGLIVGTVGGCALILLAGGIARVGHASSPPSPAVVPETEVAAATSAPLTTNVSPSPAPPAVEGTPATSSAGPSTGTVRLGRGLIPSRVLFDGKKLTSTSALVSCGTHQIRVGHGRTHSVDVPCGGEIGVAK